MNTDSLLVIIESFTWNISSWQFSDLFLKCFGFFPRSVRGLILFQGKETEHGQPTGDNWVFCFTRHQMENLESILFVKKENHPLTSTFFSELKWVEWKERSWCTFKINLKWLRINLIEKISDGCCGHPAVKSSMHNRIKTELNRF